ncbi:hypothetical protein [Neomoorella mulderi]|uniref:Uncharacterized protein n=1 Tax=Moorella mulderi DSM 14980 TaxID=1122241 RepID=A0A151AZ08_9FIRM|nr:hypothetical protein [Moorella mulderi]KYH32782.1 hypothetical protein MOMUL_13840 [Moorella mulderi DSM 14980]
MTISLNIPWHQYALIVVLAEKMYIHGPFCADLMGDLYYVNALRGVEVQYDSLSNGYKIIRVRPGIQ